MEQIEKHSDSVKRRPVSQADRSDVHYFLYYTSQV